MQPQITRPRGIHARRLSIIAMIAVQFFWPAICPAFQLEPGLSRITRSSTSKFFLRHTPDGRYLLYSSHHANRRAANQILVGARIVAADGSADHPLLPAFEAQVQIQEHPTVSPDGKRLLISGGGNDTGNSSKDVFVIEFDPAGAGTESAEFAQKLRKLNPDTPDSKDVLLGEEPAWSPDGSQIAFVTIDEKLWLADSNGHNKTTIAQMGGQYCHQPDWSPDGQWIAFASDRDGNIELFRVRRDGTELTRMTHAPGIDCRPRWSRDGRWILFTSNRNSNFDLFAMRSDGSETRQLTFHPGVDDHADWSPDGLSIAFISMRSGAFDIYRMPVPADMKIGPRLVPGAAPTSATSGPLAVHYSFERDVEGSDRIIDLVGRNHGQLHGAALVHDSRQDQNQNHLSFDGQNSWVDCGNSETLRVAGPLTISLWVRPASSAGNQYLVSKYGWNIYLGPNSVPHFETRSAADNAWDTLPADQGLPTGEWSQITSVFDPDGGQLKIYVNGQLSGMKTRTDGAIGGVAGYPLELGHYNQSRTQKFFGQLDELRILKQAMRPEEVDAEYHRQQAAAFVAITGK